MEAKPLTSLSLKNPQIANSIFSTFMLGLSKEMLSADGNTIPNAVHLKQEPEKSPEPDLYGDVDLYE